MIEGIGLLFIFVVLLAAAGLIAIVSAIPARRTLMIAPYHDRGIRSLGRRMYWSFKRRVN